MNRIELGKQYFLSGYSCAQSVVLAFKDDIGQDEEVLKKVSSSFGGGLGGLREVCGAVSGMAIVLGYLKGYSKAGNLEEKKKHYALIQTAVEKFKEKNGSYICRELLLNKEKHPCIQLVMDAVEIVCEVLNLDK